MVPAARPCNEPVITGRKDDSPASVTFKVINVPNKTPFNRTLIKELKKNLWRRKCVRRGIFGT